MTIREMLQRTPLGVLDTDQRELTQVLVLIERLDGTIRTVVLTDRPDVTSPFDLCEFFVENREEFSGDVAFRRLDDE